MARKGKSGRNSSASETRSTGSRRSSRSRGTSRSSRSRQPTEGSRQPMEVSSERRAGPVLPSQIWQSSACCAGGCKSVYGLCVPCAAATARHRLDGSSWCVNLICLNLCAARNIVRKGYGIKGHCCADIICSILCAPCVACQIMGETEKRGAINSGWDPTSGRTSFEQPWKFGLFSCFDDCGTCAYGCFCPMPAVGTIRTQMDDSDCLFNCCCLNPFVARSLVRNNYSIEGSDCADLWLTCCCFPCSVVQMLNETQHRGKTGGVAFSNIISGR
ncbi:unnamed protein product [Ascophyllum nodosum]